MTSENQLRNTFWTSLEFFEQIENFVALNVFFSNLNLFLAKVIAKNILPNQISLHLPLHASLSLRSVSLLHFVSVKKYPLQSREDYLEIYWLKKHIS